LECEDFQLKELFRLVININHQLDVQRTFTSVEYSVTKLWFRIVFPLPFDCDKLTAGAIILYTIIVAKAQSIAQATVL
jgi:hypothetical protein